MILPAAAGTRSTLLGATLASIGAVAAAAAAPAHTGSSKFETPGAGSHGKVGALHASRTIESTFQLPAGAWTNGIFPGLGFTASLVGGPYWPTVPTAGGQPCVLALNTGARASRARPALGFRPTAHGSTGRLQWFAGSTRLGGLGPAGVAEAFSPTPAGFAAPTERWTVFELTLTVSPTSTTCRQAQRSVSLTRSIESEHLARGS